MPALFDSPDESGGAGESARGRSVTPTSPVTGMLLSNAAALATEQPPLCIYSINKYIHTHTARFRQKQNKTELGFFVDRFASGSPLEVLKQPRKEGAVEARAVCIWQEQNEGRIPVTLTTA
ncbi:Hypothetical predicted protein [Podarcis lilfordi]|uniref:Uncharacterized protein n=1 Tax=Podarcis lilfordi TaxID=74358 RepID=A0AA35KI95_9SAUR|nr:Hypothetical predicted protein [Podarcis lilfordi]